MIKPMAKPSSAPDATALPDALRDTPIYDFVHQQWPQISEEFTSSPVQRDDVILFLLWSLDNLKADAEHQAPHLYKNLRDGIKTYVSAHRKPTSPQEVDILTVSVIALTMACHGLLLTDDSRAPMVYQQIEEHLGDHLQTVMKVRKEITYDDRTPALKQWLLDYWHTPSCMTISETIAWNINEQLQFDFDKVLDADLTWMKEALTREQRLNVLAYIRDAIKNAIHERKGEIRRAKAKVLYEGFHEKYAEGSISSMPPYAVAKRLLGDLFDPHPFPTEKNYNDNKKYFRTGQK